MKKSPLFLLIPLMLCGCNRKQEPETISYADYGAFLGRIDNDVTDFNKYKYVSVELDEYTHSNIQRLTNKGTYFLAYLNVGSLENYRDYYDDYESITFKDYDNWPEERWIDVTSVSWQDKMVELAQGYKNDGSFGVYMDNVDVYSVAKEEEMEYTAFGTALKSIISRVNSLGLKVMINGGAEFLDDMNDQNDNIFDSIWAYHQEEVFTLIDDYENNTFISQEEEDKTYYLEIATIMKAKQIEVFFLEYTLDNSLKETIKVYCDEKGYHYYFANSVELL